MPTYDFVEGFEALTGNRPFGWQKRLFEEWLSVGKLPLAVDIPTGLGKTSVMVIWLLARAMGAGLPRRLIYVVDRRAVVDQATRIAEQLRHSMPARLADRLELRDGTGGLPISTLRGGFADNRDWLEDPTSPAIIVGTVDMIGSQLLFEGYGVSRRMRPYHAGLLGVDALVLLDEAHLCLPFEALLRQISDHRDGKLGARTESVYTTPPFHLVSLSATGRDLANTDSIFRLKEKDHEEPVVQQRLAARKRLDVTELEAQKSLAECMANRAIELSDGETVSRVVVYCDRRKDAAQVKELVDKEFKKRQKLGELLDGWESELLVGERRVYEREKLENWLKRTGFLSGSEVSSKIPMLLVATSAGEVGVDLDADHMVCDLVAYERMVQRLGRVNRRGGNSRIATVDVFAQSEVKSASEEALDTYNRRMAPLNLLPCGEDGRHDASPSATVALKRDHPDVVAAATTSAPLYPELTRPLLGSWAMTSLDQHEGRPEVAPWLRGWEKDEPQTDMVWRKYIPYERRNDGVSLNPIMVAEFFRSAPIHATEKLEASSWRVFDWLIKRANQVEKRGQDHELAVGDEEIVAVLMDRAGEYRGHASFGNLRRLAAPNKGVSKKEKQDRDRVRKKWREELLPGAVLIVDTRIGGLRDGLLDDKSELETVVADMDEAWKEKKEDSNIECSRPLIKFEVKEIVGGEEEGLKISIESEDWRHIRTFETKYDAGGVAQCGLAVYKWLDGATDEDSRAILSAPQTLTDHANQTAERARALAKRLGLLEEEIEAFEIAARLHDDGKASDRWQSAMNAPKNGRPYAKTSGGGNWRLLEGYRHEFGSLLEAEQEDLPDRTRDLILHLIAAHHGHARPLISPKGCEDGPPSLLEFRAREAALRFARLQKQYGPWGLAWREAILRAADQGVSREWSQRSYGSYTNV